MRGEGRANFTPSAETIGVLWLGLRETSTGSAGRELAFVSLEAHLRRTHKPQTHVGVNFVELLGQFR